jgi:DnaJ-class molecular chaperone
MATCPVCDGSGECQNDYHSDSWLEDVFLVSTTKTLLGDCPACGSESTQIRGKCSTCGGSGEVDD